MSFLLILLFFVIQFSFQSPFQILNFCFIFRLLLHPFPIRISLVVHHFLWFFLDFNFFLSLILHSIKILFQILHFRLFCLDFDSSFSSDSKTHLNFLSWFPFNFLDSCYLLIPSFFRPRFGDSLFSLFKSFFSWFTLTWMSLIFIILHWFYFSFWFGSPYKFLNLSSNFSWCLLFILLHKFYFSFWLGFPDRFLFKFFIFFDASSTLFFVLMEILLFVFDASLLFNSAFHPDLFRFPTIFCCFCLICLFTKFFFQIFIFLCKILSFLGFFFPRWFHTTSRFTFWCFIFVDSIFVSGRE